MPNRYVLALDLKNDRALIAQYEAYHREVWPEVLRNIEDAGILSMEIFRVENRLMMIMKVSDDFSFERKELADASNLRVQEWEELMWKYQQAIPGGARGAKWRVMERIF